MKDLLEKKSLQAQIIFAQESQEETFHQKDLVRLFPYGLSMSADASRPFLLLKDEAHVHTLPVAISPIEAGVSLAQSNRTQLESSPHKFTALLLESLDIQVRQAVFVEIRGSHQYMRLYLSGHKNENSIKLRADEAMSLCLYLEIPLFATKAFIGRSRVMNAEMDASTQRGPGVSLSGRIGYLN